MDTMLAARYLGPKRIETEVVPIPVIGSEEALIQVEACGFCGSDMNIVQIGNPSSGWEVGEHVTVYPLISCGTWYSPEYDSWPTQ
jgi:threonine dehydrogenase-like Zn-dependent dehydrogenase